MRQVKEQTTLVGVSELRTQVDEIMGATRTGPVIIEKRHKPFAVLVSIEQYERTEEVLEYLEDTVLGLLAKEREHRTPHARYLSLEELERRVGLRMR